MTMLLALVEQIGPLEAGDALLAAQVVAVGGGNMKQADLDSVVSRWKRAVDGGGPRGPKRELDAHLNVAAELGIEVIRG